MSGALKPVSAFDLGEVFRIKPGDRLHRLIARLCDTWIDDLSDERIVELETLADSWRLTHSNGRRFGDALAPAQARAVIAHDGFAGDIIGHYVTREGKRGVVVQQDGTRVVHVYGEKWLAPSPPAEGV